MIKALAIGRVSTKNQADNNHSLQAQMTNIDEMEVELRATIVRRWEMAISSRRGKNLKRTDLNEAKRMCALDKHIKYIFLDKVNRLGREAKYLAYYMLDLEFTYGVRLIFCDPKQRELNKADDPKTFLKIVEKLVEAEQDNEERIETTTAKMKERVRLGYYPFYPHQGYKKTEAVDGLHVPDRPRYDLLRYALKAVANFEMTPEEALKWLDVKGYRTPIILRKDKNGIKQKKGGRKLDMNHFRMILVNPYYAGILKVRDWPVNEHGLHEAMLTWEEWEINTAIISGKKVRQKLQFNPDFRLNLALHEPCISSENEHDGKVTGINHSNGKGWQRKEYVCRTCKKRVPQAVVHDALSEIMEQLGPSSGAQQELIDALAKVWRNKEAYRIENLKQYELNKQALLDKKAELISTLSANPELAEDIKEEIIRVKAKIVALEEPIAKASKVDEDFNEFMEYALRYVEDLRNKWWDLPRDSLKECKQLLFNDEIIIQPGGKVYTPKISPIYSLYKAKSDPKVAQNCNMVELAGSAPASVGLSGYSSTGVVRFRILTCGFRN